MLCADAKARGEVYKKIKAKIINRYINPLAATSYPDVLAQREATTAEATE